MSDRDAAIAAFVKAAGWGYATIAPLAGDASNRRYLRLTRAAAPQRAVLMDASPDKGEDVRPFVTIASFLAQAGFSAPEIYHADEAQGLLLIEDLGDDLYKSLITRAPHLENSLYACAIDVLVALHDVPPPETLVPYSIPLMTELAALAYDWYRAASLGEDASAKSRFMQAMSACLTQHAPAQDVLIQRDYHSENLLWLPEREGIARVGLLDFQDAMLGHRAYDLVSLLQDDRRDVPPEIERAMIARYCTATGQDRDRFEAAYHTLGAQRNLRILGVFARLCLRDGKAHYVSLIPRVWGLLLRDLAHPALCDLRPLLLEDLPPASAELCQGLKEKCATHQTP